MVSMSKYGHFTMYLYIYIIICTYIVQCASRVFCSYSFFFFSLMNVELSTVCKCTYDLLLCRKFLKQRHLFKSHTKYLFAKPTEDYHTHIVYAFSLSICLSLSIYLFLSLWYNLQHSLHLFVTAKTNKYFVSVNIKTKNNNYE